MTVLRVIDLSVRVLRSKDYINIHIYLCQPSSLFSRRWWRPFQFGQVQSWDCIACPPLRIIWIDPEAGRQVVAVFKFGIYFCLRSAASVSEHCSLRALLSGQPGPVFKCGIYFCLRSVGVLFQSRLPIQPPDRAQFCIQYGYNTGLFWAGIGQWTTIPILKRENLNYWKF